ncbi:MAG TPA: hemerythrin domain-containing protein [Kofleriaceae bacterium]
MLFQLGSRPPIGKVGEVVEVGELLAACHGRIRRFLDLAARLATTSNAGAPEVRETAGQIRRYFAEALPLHIADEDELIAPRLAGRSAELDATLATMHADHADHASLVDRVIDLCAGLHRDPDLRATHAAALAEAAAALRGAFEPHLALEERVVFPAISALPAAERRAIEEGMRRRRET